ncbi:MAG: DNA gyrase C-terminal beta-propeller domain-containing protein, partial [Oceanococcaceae bacterium]
DESRLNDAGYQLSEVQAQAILDLRLHRLTGLEQDKIRDEFNDILDQIAGYLDILARRERLLEVIHEELVAVKEEFNDPRRSEISSAIDDFEDEDLIPPQDMVVTMSHKGYVKTQQLDIYQAQRRGGVGRSAAKTREEDYVDKLWVTHTHDTLLCFSSLGKVYWMRVFRLPTGGRDSRGRPIVNLLPLADNEHISQVLPIKEYRDDHYVVMVTKRGTIKKVPLEQFSRPRSVGLIALDLRVDDELVSVDITDGERNLMLFTRNGRVCRFDESAVRAMGRTAFGVRGIRLAGDDAVISMIVDRGEQVLTVSENGYGKRSGIEEYPVKGRGTQGVLSMKLTEKTGKVVAAIPVSEGDDIMLIAASGQLVRTAVREVSVLSRNTQGVRLINLKGTHLVGVDRIDASLIVENEGVGDAVTPPDAGADDTAPPTPDTDL